MLPDELLQVQRLLYVPLNRKSDVLNERVYQPNHEEQTKRQGDSVYCKV